LIPLSTVIWWDFDATLVSRPSMWTEVAVTLLDREVPGHGISVETLAPHVWTGMPWQRADYAHPELSTPDLWWDAVKQRYAEIFTTLGQPQAATADALAALRADILTAARYRVFEDGVPALRRSRAAGWRNIMVSNHIPELAQLVAALDLTPHFDAIVSSGVVGYEKPHRRLFEAALQHVRPGEQVWMIGDNVDADCHPVCALGMNAVLVRHPKAGTFARQAADLNEALDLVEAG
jgi:putative hydrolase of the HAD superfamily